MCFVRSFSLHFFLREKYFHINLIFGFFFSDIPKVMIEPSGPVHGPERNGTISKGDGGHANRIPDAGSTRWPLRTPYIPPVITSWPTHKPTTRPTPNPTPQPTPPPPPPLPTELRTTPPPPPTPERPPTTLMTVAPDTRTSPQVTTADSGIQTDPQKPRGDVFSKSHEFSYLFKDLFILFCVHKCFVFVYVIYTVSLLTWVRRESWNP